MICKTTARTLTAAAMLPLAALGAEATGTLSVSVTALSSCTVTPLPLAFGNYTPASGGVTATTTLAVLCTLNTPYKVRLGAGENSADVAGRKMKVALGTETLDYGLFTDAGHTSNWGQTDGVDTVDDTGAGVANTHTVYGLIPGSQFVPAGAYTDNVTITVNY